MMYKAREHKGSITRFLHAHPEVVDLVPTDKEWKVCEVMENVLLPFYDFTRSVSKDQPCLSESISIMQGLDDLLDDVSKADGKFSNIGDDIQDAFKAGVSKVEEYTQLVNDNIMYYAAAVLDPQIKTTLIKEQCEDGADDIIKRIQEYLKKESLQEQVQAPKTIEVSILQNTNRHQLGLLQRAHKTTASVLCDIDRYLNSEAIDWDENDEANYHPDWVLNWWKANEFLYPLMAKVACDILAVPASEVDVERLFSGRRDLLGIRRYALKGEMMRVLTLLKAFFERQLKKGTADLLEVYLQNYSIWTSKR